MSIKGHIYNGNGQEFYGQIRNPKRKCTKITNFNPQDNFPNTISNLYRSSQYYFPVRFTDQETQNLISAT